MDPGKLANFMPFSSQTNALSCAAWLFLILWAYNYSKSFFPSLTSDELIAVGLASTTATTSQPVANGGLQ